MRSARFRESWLLPFLLISALPLFWTIWALSSGFALSGDNAWMALRTYDIFSSNPPLTGMPSTSSADAPGVYAHHPGPFQFVLIAPFYALSGWATWAMSMGSLAVNLGMVAVALWAAWRIDLSIAKFVAVSGSLMVTLSLQALLMHPWNPRPVQMGMIALAMLTWAIMIGRTGCWPWFVFVSAIVAQGHVAGLLIVWFTVLVMIGLGMWFGFPRRPPRRELWFAIGVFVVAWALPIWDVLSDWPGNLGELLSYMTRSSGGAGEPSEWEYFNWYRKLVIYGAIAVVAVLRGKKLVRYSSSERADKEWGAGLLVVGLMSLGAFLLTFAGGPDRLGYNHILNGIFWAGLFILVANPPSWWSQWSRWSVVAILVVAFNINTHKTGFQESVAEFREHSEMSAAALELVERHEDLPIVVKHHGSYSWLNLYPATVLELALHGLDVHYDPVGQPYMYDTQRRIDKIEGPRLELMISDRSDGKRDADSYDPDEVLEVKVFNLNSSRIPIALTLARVGGS